MPEEENDIVYLYIFFAQRRLDISQISVTSDFNSKRRCNELGDNLPRQLKEGFADLNEGRVTCRMDYFFPLCKISIIKFKA